MKPSSWTVRFGIAGLALMGGLLGGTLQHWMRQPTFPIYGYVVDIALLAAIITGVVYLRRWKAMVSDEFSVAKKRLAMQIGLQVAFALYVFVNIVTAFFPAAFQWLLGAMTDKHDAFVAGQAIGLCALLIGLISGFAAAEWKYR